MQPLILDKDRDGLPLPGLIADLSSRLPIVSFTHSALWGCLSATIEWSGTLDEGFTAADRWLGNPVEIWSDDAEWLWEGMVWGVSFGAGQRQRTRSLEHYAEWGVGLYNQVEPFTGQVESGPPLRVTAGVPSTLRPGFVLNVGPMDETIAQARIDQELTQRRRLLWLPDTGGTLPLSGAGAPLVSLDCIGWFRTLWYPPVERTGGALVDVGPLVRDLLAASAPYINTDLSQIALDTPGQTFDLFDTYETPGEIIKRIVPQAQGGSIDSEYVFGIGQGRVPYLRPSKRFQTTPDYLEQVTGSVHTSGGGAMPSYLVRPDSVIRQVDFVPASVAVTSAIDTVENIYIAETRFESDTASVTYRGSIPGVLGEVGST